jgi:hypothetical protein
MCLSNGGWSWSIPYIAALYTLCCQVNANITPEIFWEEALKTGETIEIKRENKTYRLGKIANPVRLIENLKSRK